MTKLVQFIEFLRQRLKTVVIVCGVLLALLVVLDAIPALVDKEHAHTSWEKIPGFWALFGFAGSVIIILASKAFGHAGAMKREDYYDE
jgi:short subunit fatty acids transporter